VAESQFSRFRIISGLPSQRRVDDVEDQHAGFEFHDPHAARLVVAGAAARAIEWVDGDAARDARVVMNQQVGIDHGLLTEALAGQASLHCAFDVILEVRVLGQSRILGWQRVRRRPVVRAVLREVDAALDI
jgi:hypothetical protein